MAPQLFYTELSPAVRGVLLNIKALGIEVELVPVNLMAGEHMTPEFLKMNPQHTVPTLKDGDFAIWDSHAINAYLVGKYGKDDSLYPKDLEKRAVIDQKLHFDSGILFPRFGAIVASILREGAKSIAKDKADFLVQGYTFLETFLENQSYVAGEELSIADFNIVATVSSANGLVPVASNRFPNIIKWLSKMEALPYYSEANGKGLNLLIGMLKSKLA